MCALNVSLSHPLRGVIPPHRGGKGAGKPKGDRATTKRNKLPFAMPYSDGAVSPIRSGPKVPIKKKKKSTGSTIMARNKAKVK